MSCLHAYSVSQRMSGASSLPSGNPTNSVPPAWASCLRKQLDAGGQLASEVGTLITCTHDDQLGRAFTPAEHLSSAGAADRSEENARLHMTALLAEEDVHGSDYLQQLDNLCVDVLGASLEDELDDRNFHSSVRILSAALRKYRQRYRREFELRDLFDAVGVGLLLSSPLVPSPTSAMDFNSAVQELWNAFRGHPDPVERLHNVMFLLDVDWTCSHGQTAFVQRPVASSSGLAYAQIEAAVTAAYRGEGLRPSECRLLEGEVAATSLALTAVSGDADSSTGCTHNEACLRSAFKGRVALAAAYWRDRPMAELTSLTRGQPVFLACQEGEQISVERMQVGYEDCSSILLGPAPLPA